jgi:peptidyl-prolyl cis-trans isomerase C
MKRKILLLVLAVLVIGFGLLIVFKTKNDENVLARIRGRKITLKEFQERIAEIPSYYRGFLATVNGKMELLDGMIAEAVLIEKAKEEGLHRKEEINSRLRIAEDRVLLEAMVQELQKGRIAVSDEEVEDYFEKHKEEFSNPEQVRVSHILVRTKSEAQKILDELRGGASFEKLVQEYSIDSITALKGGDLGYISRGEMIPVFEEAIFALEKKNDISQIIETPFGYHLVKLTDRRKADKKTPEEIQNEIRTRIQNQKLKTLIEKYKKELTVSVNRDLLDKVSVGVKSEDKGGIRNEERESKTP